jgi:uncharacterized repeat protein (TIGR01451 family)
MSQPVNSLGGNVNARRVRKSGKSDKSAAELRRLRRATRHLSLESLEPRSLMAVVSLGEVVPLAEGFGYGSTIAGLGKAIDLSTPNHFVSVRFNNAGNAIRESGKFTMEAWVYPKPGQTDGLIWNYGSAYSLHRVGDTGLRFVMPRIGIYDRKDIGIDLTANKVMTADAWNHLAVTYDGDRVQMFVNGVEVAASVPFNPDPVPLRLYPIDALRLLGTPVQGTSNNHAGAMDEIRVWSVARTQAEIQGSMLTPLLGDEPGLIGYWNFDNPNPDFKDQQLDLTPSANIMFNTGVGELLNAAPQIGYVDVLLDEKVQDSRGLWVAFNVTGGTATFGEDFTTSAFRKVSNVPSTERNGVIIPKGANSGRIYFVARPDAIAEPTESFTVSLAPYSFSGQTNSDYVIGSQSSKTVSIVDSGAYRVGAAVLDSRGREVTSSSPLYVDPVTKTATFSVRLTSEPDFPGFTPENALIKLNATTAGVDNGRGASSELVLVFDPSNWDQLKPFSLTSVQGAGVITLTSVGALSYLSQPITFPYTLVPPTDARVQEANPLDVAPVKPTVNVVLGTGVLEGSELPGRAVVVLNTPAPAGGLDVFYSVTSTAREGVDFQRLTGVIHVEEGQREATIPVLAIDNRIAHGNRAVTIQLGTASSTYLVGANSRVDVPLIDDDKARVVAVNSQTIDLTQAKDVKRVPVAGEEITLPYTLNDDTKAPLGTVGVYDSPSWTYSGALGGSFTAGLFDADRLEFVLGATADASAKIRVRVTPTDENGQPTVRLVKTGADGVNSVAIASMLDATSGTGTRLRGGSLSTARLPTIVDDNTLEWSLAGLPAGTYQVILATTPNLSNILTNPGTSTGVSFRYNAEFTSNPVAPYQVFTTTTVSSFSDNYTPLVTSEPLPTAILAAEPNNTVATATALGTAYDEQLVTSQVLDVNSDVDIYRFKLDAAAGRPDTLVAEFLRPTGGVNPLLLDILNPDGSVRINAAARSQNQYVSLASLPDGEYFARVRTANTSVGRTEFSLRFRTLTNASEQDANNSITQATYLGTALEGDRYNDLAIVGSTDQDFYRFTLNSSLGRPAQVSVISRYAAGALFVQLVNATTGASINQPAGTSDIRTMSLASLPDGDYGLRVEAENTGIQNKYDIAFGAIVPRQAEVSPNRIAFRLDTRPNANVTVNFTSSNTKQGVVSPNTLVFTPANWNVYQLLTVTPLDDGLFGSDVTYTVTGKATSSDPAYQNHVVTASVTNVDRGDFVQPEEIDTQDELGKPVVTISPLAKSAITEGLTAQAFRLTLDKAFAQTTTVMVDFSRGTAVEGVNFRMNDGSLSPYAVVFPAGVTQRDVTITTTRDQVQRTVQSEPLTIRATVLDGDGYRPARTADPGYSAAVSLSEVDQAGFSIIHESGALASTKIANSDEFSKAATRYRIALTSKPKADVFVPIASSDPTEGLLKTDLSQPGAPQVVLRFTPDNWNLQQTFYVQGVDDPIVDGIVSYQFVVSADGDDDVYRALNPVSFSASNGDDDVAGITVTSPQATVDGRTNVFSVRLNNPPVGEVRVNMTPRNDQVSINGERAGETATLVFTALNWNVAQLVKVVANDDKVVEYFHTSQIDFKVDTGRIVPDAPGIDNSTSATAIHLGDIKGGLRIENMSLPKTTSLFPGEEWYRFKISESLTSHNNLRLTTAGSNQIYLPSVEIIRASDMVRVIRAEPTSALRNANGDVLAPAFLKQALRGLAFGEYYVRLVPTSSADPQFTLWLDDGDRTYESVQLASIPVSIKDDDLPIAELLAGPSASEVFSEPSYVAVRLNTPAAATPGSTGVRVNFQVTGGSATRGTSQSIEHDYNVIADSFDPVTGIGWVRVAPGDIQANIGIQPIDDKLVEDLPLELSQYNRTTGKVTVSGLASVLKPNDATAATVDLARDTKIVAQLANGRELVFNVGATTTLNRTGSGATATFRGDVSVTLSEYDAADAPTLTQTPLKARAKSETVAITLLPGVDYVLPLAPDKQNAPANVAANLDANRVQATLTIFDDDVPGIEIIEVGEHTTVAEGDEARYQVSLVAEPSQDVVVTMTPGMGLAFVKPANKSTETFTPTRYNMSLVGAPDNLDVTLVSIDETDKGFTASFDVRLTRPKITSVAQTLPLMIEDSGAGVGVANASSDTTVFEIPAAGAVDFAGSPAKGNWEGTRRLTIPNLVRKSTGEFSFVAKLGGTTPATITLTPAATTPLSVVGSKLTFTRANWFVPQIVTIAGLNDGFAQPGEWRKSVITYRVSSQDLIWDGSPVPVQEVHIRDTQLEVGDTLDGISGAFGALTLGMQGLEVPLVGSVGELPGVAQLFSSIESPLQRSIGAQEHLTVQTFEEIAESALQPLEDSGTVDEIEVTPSSNEDEVRVTLHVEKRLPVASVSLDADLGLEALGIKFATTGTATIDMYFQFDITIGWHRTFGLFIDTAETGIEMGAKLSLQGPASSPQSPFSGVGSLGFLQLDFTNDPDNPTELAFTFQASLNDLDNIATTQFFDLNGDGILADTPAIYQVGVDQSPKDGRIDLNAQGNPSLTSITTAALEPLVTINGTGQSSAFPTVSDIAKAGAQWSGAAQANWNTIGTKGASFDEAELTLNEGQYLKETRGSTTIVFLDANRNGKLDVARRNVDPAATPWTSLSTAEKDASEVWVTTTSSGAIPEFRILTTGTGTATRYHLDVNRNGRADTGEEISAKLRKKLDKDNSKTLEADVRQDGEGSFVQGTSTAFYDWNANQRQDFNEPFISFAFQDFALDLDVAIEDAGNLLFIDLDGDGERDSNEPRVLYEDFDSVAVLDLNANGIRDTNEPATKRATQQFSIAQSQVNSATSTISFNTYSRPVLTVDGIRFIDLDRNGELTTNGDGTPLEPWAEQRVTLENDDINRLIQRIHAANPSLFAAIRTDIEKLQAGTTLDSTAQARVASEFRKQVGAGRIIVQPGDGDRLTLAELNAYRKSQSSSGGTRADKAKSTAEDLFTFQFLGGANIGFKTRSSISGSTMMPSLEFDLAVSLPLFNYGNSEQADDQGFSVEFKNVAMDLGSFLQGYVEPILATANDVIGPIKPIVTALNADTKLLGKLGLASLFESDGRPGVSLLEIARKIKSGNAAEVAKIDKAIKFAGQIQTLVDVIDTLSESIGGDSTKLQFGDFSLNDLRAASDEPANSAAQTRSTRRTDGSAGATTAVPRTTSAQIENQAKKSSALGNKFNALKRVDGLTINLFEPSTVMALIMGEPNVNLVTYDVPDFAFDFKVSRQFRIWGPIAGKLEGGFSVSTDLMVGYDTAGIQAWSESGFDPLKSYLVLDGVFVNDWTDAGVEKDELTVSAFVAAGVGIDIGIASGFVKGGVEGTVGFDLIDAGERGGTSDGKIRGSDIIQKLSTAPADLFDLSGKVSAFLAAEVRVNLLFFKKKVYDNKLASFELARFRLSPGAGSGSSLAGKVQTGPIAGGTVWFDANNNLVRDDGEPFAITDIEGNYELIVPDDFDLATGTIRVEGGKDASTGLDSLVVVATPIGGNATALTSLEEALVTDVGLGVEESQALIEETFGIDPNVLLSTFAHHDEALAGNALAGPVLVAENNVNSLIHEIVAALAGAAGVPLGDRQTAGIFSEAAYIALARHLHSHDLDLTDIDQLKLIVHETATIANQLFLELESSVQVDITRLASYENEIAGVLQTTVLVQREVAAQSASVVDMAHHVTQAKVMANGQVANSIYRMVRGEIPASQLLDDYGGSLEAALAAIGIVELPPLVSQVPDIQAIEDEPVAPIPFSVRRQTSAPGAITVDVFTDNESLLPEGAIVVNPLGHSQGEEQFELIVTPAAYMFGQATITLHVADSAGEGTTETFLLDVAWKNHAPIAEDDTAIAVPGRSVVVHPLNNDSDFDEDFLRVGLVSVPEDGEAVVGFDGEVTYTPAAQATGTRTLVYEVDDGNGGVATASITFELQTGAADLEVSQTVSPYSMSGHELVFAFTVRNTGPESALGVVVWDQLPPEVTFVSATTPEGFVVEAPAVGTTGEVVFYANELPHDAVVNFLVVGRVSTMTQDGVVLLNQVSAYSESFDIEPANNTSTSETTNNRSGVTLAPSAVDVGQTDLVVWGSASANNIQVQAAAQGMVRVIMDRVTYGPFQPTARIVVFAGSGNDTVRIDSSIKQAALVFGDQGNDTLYAGNSPTVLVGGDDQDTLIAGRGRNLLLGGLGADRLDGSVGDNLLIGGVTNHDAHQKALVSLLSEWSSPATGYDSRITHLTTGSGGLNDGYRLDAETVRDDAAIDMLIGGLGQNWYFSHELTSAKKDQIQRRKANERVTRL